MPTSFLDGAYRFYSYSNDSIDGPRKHVEWGRSFQTLGWQRGKELVVASGGSVCNLSPDLRVKGVSVDGDRLTVDLMDGRSIAVPLAWYPRLFDATPEQRRNWEPAGGGYGIHWPDIDEDLSTEGLLRSAPAPRSAA